MNDDSPSRQIDEMKAPLFSYVTLGPLIAALFAEKIDNDIAVCILFVCLIGGMVFWLKKRLAILETACIKQEQRLAELTVSPKEEGESEPDTDSQSRE